MPPTPKKNTSNIWLIKGFDDGRPCYFYVMSDSIRTHLIKKTENQKGVDLTRFGEIIESGFGEEPPEDVKARMKEEYGFE